MVRLGLGSYLMIASNAQRGRELCPLRQRQVLRPEEESLQLPDLQRRVDGFWLSDLIHLAFVPG